MRTISHFLIPTGWKAIIATRKEERDPPSETVNFESLHSAWWLDENKEAISFLDYLKMAITAPLLTPTVLESQHVPPRSRSISSRAELGPSERAVSPCPGSGHQLQETTPCVHLLFIPPGILNIKNMPPAMAWINWWLLALDKAFIFLSWWAKASGRKAGNRPGTLNLPSLEILRVLPPSLPVSYRFFSDISWSSLYYHGAVVAFLKEAR